MHVLQRNVFPQGCVPSKSVVGVFLRWCCSDADILGLYHQNVMGQSS